MQCSEGGKGQKSVKALSGRMAEGMENRVKKDG